MPTMPTRHVSDKELHTTNKTAKKPIKTEQMTWKDTAQDAMASRAPRASHTQQDHQSETLTRTGMHGTLAPQRWTWDTAMQVWVWLFTHVPTLRSTCSYLRSPKELKTFTQKRLLGDIYCFTRNSPNLENSNVHQEEHKPQYNRTTN